MRKGILALAGSLAGLEVFNRSVVLPREQLEPQLPVEPRMWRWRQGEVAVYERGANADKTNLPLVLLHGHNAAASAMEMREPFMRLSEHFHVYAPDLLGYGLSDRPGIDYTPRLYIDLIEDLLREVVERPAAVLASSLTSAYAIEVAANNPEWVTSLVLVCPTGIRRLTEQSPGGRATEMLLGLPILGEAMYNGIASRPSIRYFLQAQTYYDPSRVTAELVERYHRTSHAPGARYAPTAFVSGKLYHDVTESWPRVGQNSLLIWGREATFTPVSDSAAYLATNPGARVEVIEKAGVLPHDEQPEQFANLVSDWLNQDVVR